ncbi:MAG: (deoxy)nucleoside triphosphate pyrophosphohydrolase [Bifidobacterium sp.]|nr:(deoxy)nucleoside triphosphate pyrophosphohydrolase [Bifidobacterium sp.]
MNDPVKSTKVTHVVGAAIINDEGHVLCSLRALGKTLAGFWEFPGGKVEPGEDPRHALRREVREELDCDVRVGDEVCSSTYLYDFGRVELTVFICRLRAGHPLLNVKEHERLKWVKPSEMPSLNWAPVDHDAVRAISRMDFAGGEE